MSKLHISPICNLYVITYKIHINYIYCVGVSVILNVDSCLVYDCRPCTNILHFSDVHMQNQSENH